MTKLKKHLVLLATVSLIALPTVTFAEEAADIHTGTVDFELVEGTIESSTTEPTESETSESKKDGITDGNQSTDQPRKYGTTLPKTGEVVNFFSAFFGVVLLGISGLLIRKRKKGGDAG
ncbi:LPXTG cell wall anchor domain-containing protein [Enterococcus asini]|uniref:LPXTG cell wall anchor domain-containing protein n=1 Tax=Enterococcus asini TaxID=57732 RepID=UPI00288D24B1|nr:LPXTG cell wall anchor domain-containing protein [Enterococcus asini]MDT2757549.1 LPXTG cell wall anchor domain-containing protein [Enterococcus asini]